MRKLVLMTVIAAFAVAPMLAGPAFAGSEDEQPPVQSGVPTNPEQPQGE
jgi:hypothetical protein